MQRICGQTARLMALILILFPQILQVWRTAIFTQFGLLRGHSWAKISGIIILRFGVFFSFQDRHAIMAVV